MDSVGPIQSGREDVVLVRKKKKEKKEEKKVDIKFFSFSSFFFFLPNHGHRPSSLHPTLLQPSGSLRYFLSYNNNYPQTPRLSRPTRTLPLIKSEASAFCALPLESHSLPGSSMRTPKVTWLASSGKARFLNLSPFPPASRSSVPRWSRKSRRSCNPSRW